MCVRCRYTPSDFPSHPVGVLQMHPIGTSLRTLCVCESCKDPAGLPFTSWVCAAHTPHWGFTPCVYLCAANTPGGALQLLSVLHNIAVVRHPHCVCMAKTPPRGFLPFTPILRVGVIHSSVGEGCCKTSQQGFAPAVCAANTLRGASFRTHCVCVRPSRASHPTVGECML